MPAQVLHFSFVHCIHAGQAAALKLELFFLQAALKVQSRQHVVNQHVLAFFALAKKFLASPLLPVKCRSWP
jgi:hypothetical protein